MINPFLDISKLIMFCDGNSVSELKCTLMTSFGDFLGNPTIRNYLVPFVKKNKFRSIL